ncbi:MAG: diacylglycerol kinase family protein [Chloroflexi bacterium]|jgi:diacylglycerol kinase|nr:diacylglycerol kinase family protein [Chloroflexota bacterium]
MPKKATTEAEQFVKSRKNSFLAAFQGLAFVLRTQRNAWIHLAMTIIVVGISIFLHLDIGEWITILLVIGLVWLAEFLNTAFEVLVDLASPEIHPLAKISKDVGAASVLIAAILAVIIGILILGPAIIQKFNIIG